MFDGCQVLVLFPPGGLPGAFLPYRDQQLERFALSFGEHGEVTLGLGAAISTCVRRELRVSEANCVRGGFALVVV